MFARLFKTSTPGPVLLSGPAAEPSAGPMAPVSVSMVAALLTSTAPPTGERVIGNGDEAVAPLYCRAPPPRVSRAWLNLSEHAGLTSTDRSSTRSRPWLTM